MKFEEILEVYRGFEWDQGNSEKNWVKHKVTQTEAEEVFLNEPLMGDEDVKHSTMERRYLCLGQTNQGRCLFISFTLRKNKIRVISARDQDKQERSLYAKPETHP